MKKTNKLFTILIVLVLALSMMSVSAFAATTVTGTNTITFDKYLTMDENADVPNADFNFTIASGTAVDAVTVNDPLTPEDDRTPAVMSGPAGANLTYNGTTAATVTVDFKAGDTTYTTVQGDDTVTLTAGEKYAAKTVNVDLTAVTFTEPGIYRYNITEAADNDGVTNDTVSTRYLDIYIESNNDGDLSFKGGVLHNTTEVMGALGGEYTAKDGGFENAYTTHDLTISKQITGNQGFRSKYFTFTVNISGADADTKYTVNLTDATNAANPATIVADDNGDATATFLLKDDESIVIYGLTAATQYTISEDAEDYTPSYTLDGGTSVDGNSTPANVAMGDSDHSVEFTNYRNGVVPTGILLDIAPYAVIVLLAGAAAALIIIKKRRSNAR